MKLAGLGYWKGQDEKAVELVVWRRFASVVEARPAVAELAAVFVVGSDFVALQACNAVGAERLLALAAAAEAAEEAGATSAPQLIVSGIQII